MRARFRPRLVHDSNIALLLQEATHSPVLCEWEPDFYGRSLARRASDLERAPVPLDDVLGDGEAETGTAAVAAACGVDPIKSFSDAREVLRCDALPIIADRQQGAIAIAARF